MKNITKLKKAINNSNINTEVKAEINNYIETTMKIHLQVPILYYVAALYGLASLIALSILCRSLRFAGLLCS